MYHRGELRLVLVPQRRITLGFCTTEENCVWFWYHRGELEPTTGSSDSSSIFSEKGTRVYRHHNIMAHKRPEKRKALDVEVADIVEMEWKTSTGDYITVKAAVLGIVSDDQIRVLMPDQSQEIIKTCPLRGRSPKYRKMRLVREAILHPQLQEDEVEEKEVDEDEGGEDKIDEDEGEEDEMDEDEGKEGKENNDKENNDKEDNQSVKGKEGSRSIFLHALDGMQDKHKEPAHDLFDSEDTYVSPEWQCMNSCLLAMSTLPQMQPVRDAPEMSRRIRFMESQVQKLAMTLTPLSEDIAMKQDEFSRREQELNKMEYDLNHMEENLNILQQEEAVKTANLQKREVSVEEREKKLEEREKKLEEREKKLEEREKKFAQLRDLMKSFI